MMWPKYGKNKPLLNLMISNKMFWVNSTVFHIIIIWLLYRPNSIRYKFQNSRNDIFEVYEYIKMILEEEIGWFRLSIPHTQIALIILVLPRVHILKLLPIYKLIQIITTFLRKPRHVSKSFIMDFPIGCHVESISMFIDSSFLLWKCISKRTKYSYYYAHRISH